MDTSRAASQALAEILACVRGATGLDFSHYREPTMQRRVQTRMIALGIACPGDYLARLRADPEEARRLLERLTVKVSRFYRNAPVFDLLRESLLPALGRGRALRLWCAGCGRGEEAYTLAMLLEERGIEGRVLATDIDPAALRHAFAALYCEDTIAELPADLRERFLVPRMNGLKWSVCEAVRRRIEFCRHDLLGPLQPRAGSFDVVACRNVVIYLERDMHDRAVANLAGALAGDGILVLGEAEWPSPALESSLEPLAPRLRVFRARAGEPAAA
jgi:chemotaxis protein methyltransferase CheR